MRQARGTGHDARPPLALVRRGCRARDPRSCLVLGDLLAHGMAGRRDLPAALGAYLRACDGGLRGACVAGARSARGATARHLRARACRLGDRASCAAGAP